MFEGNKVIKDVFCKKNRKKLKKVNDFQELSVVLC